MRSWQGGRARHLGVAADHAWLAEACVRLSELTGRAIWRERATKICDTLLELFYDTERGGFFTTGSDAEALVVRPKEFVDGALPSTNSICVWALLRVHALSDDPRLIDAVEATVGLARALIDRHPGALADLVSALPMRSGRQEIVVTGPRDDLVMCVRGQWLPASVLAWGEPGTSPLFADRAEGFAYVCRGATCDLPAGDTVTLIGQLEALGR